MIFVLLPPSAEILFTPSVSMKSKSPLFVHDAAYAFLIVTASARVTREPDTGAMKTLGEIRRCTEARVFPSALMDKES
jgi:hypothetical protein